MAKNFPRTQRRTRRTGSAHAAAARTTRLAGLESLEQRQMLTTFTVDHPGDGFDADLTDGLCATLSGSCTLRAAVEQANHDAGADRVDFAPQIAGVALYFGEIVVNDSVVIDGSTANVIPIPIQASPGSRIFLVDDFNPLVDRQVDMNDLSLELGAVIGPGGAVLNFEEFELKNSVVTGNSAVNGGGIANYRIVRLDDVQVDGNTASLSGGGLFNGVSPFGQTARAEIDRSVFIHNEASNPLADTFGGGIYTGNAATTVLRDSSLIDNTANYPAAPMATGFGGGMATQSGSIAQLFNSSVLENHAGDAGGGVFHSQGQLLVQDSMVYANNAGRSGGGLHLDDAATADIFGSEIHDNRAEMFGGGVTAAAGVQLTVASTQVYDNSNYLSSADGTGGGFYLGDFGSGAGPTVDIRNSSIRGNNYGLFTQRIEGERGGGIGVGAATDLTIDQTLIRDNKALIAGGGLFATTFGSGAASVVTITNSQILENQSLFLGGGIASEEQIQLDISNSEVSMNDAGDGGGFYLSGNALGGLNVTTISGTDIANNHAAYFGGGISAGPDSRLQVDDSLLLANRTEGRGGGMYLSSRGTGATQSTTVTASEIRRNRAIMNSYGSDAYAAGVWAGDAVVLDVSKTTISNNRADNLGGGFMIDKAAAVDVRDSSVTGNSASAGGGVYLRNASANFLQDTFYGNSANQGGGLYLFAAAPAQVTLAHTTITKNSVSAAGVLSYGGGIHIKAAPNNVLQLALSHTIVAANINLNLLGGPDLYDGPNSLALPATTATFSLIGSQSGTAFAAAHPDASGNIIGSIFAPVDPLLGGLMNNGGPTSTVEPMGASPAVDVGDPAFTGSPSHDQRQAPYQRIFHGRIDIGAVERQPAPPDGDFNADGIYSCDDIDMLTTEIASMTHNPHFDMTLDGAVDGADLDAWLLVAGNANLGAHLKFRPADANLDGVVDASDFNIWNANKFLVDSRWCHGDFNADGVVDTSDFNIWNANKFQGPIVVPRPAPEAEPAGARDRNVPVLEPGSSPLPAAGLPQDVWHRLEDRPIPRRTRMVDIVFGEDIPLFTPR